MKKIILIFFVLVLIILTTSCEKEVNINNQNLMGKWKSKYCGLIYDFYSDTCMYRISISSNDTTRYKYTTSEDGHLYLDAGDYISTYNISFKNERKLLVSGIFGYDVGGEEDPYFEFTKMLIQ